MDILNLGFASELVFPKTLSAANRRISSAGVDALAVTLEDLGNQPLQEHEQLYFLEAKHSLVANVDAPIDALLDDLRKTDLRRVHDELQLLASQLQMAGFEYPERVNEFLTTSTKFGLLVLYDPDITEPRQLLERATRRLPGRSAAAGIPVSVVCLVSVADLEGWVQSTL